MPNSPEYYIRKVTVEGVESCRYGLYSGGTLMGYYTNYQSARRDLLQMREQPAVVGELRNIFSYTYVANNSPANNVVVRDVTWNWDASPSSSASTITLNSDMAREAYNIRVEQIRREYIEALLNDDDSGR